MYLPCVNVCVCSGLYLIGVKHDICADELLHEIVEASFHVPLSKSDSIRNIQMMLTRQQA